VTCDQFLTCDYVSPTEKWPFDDNHKSVENSFCLGVCVLCSCDLAGCNAAALPLPLHSSLPHAASSAASLRRFLFRGGGGGGAQGKKEIDWGGRMRERREGGATGDTSLENLHALVVGVSHDDAPFTVDGNAAMRAVELYVT